MKDISNFVETCHLIQAKGLVSGSGGNISIRYEDKFLITPSGRSLESLSEEDLIVLGKDGHFISTNNGIPSKEWRMHLACYNRGDVNAVVHIHSTYAVAISCISTVNKDCAIPIYTPGYGIRVGNLPLIPYYTPGSTELYKAVETCIGYRNSLLLKNHGIVTVGKNLEVALDIAEEIEEEAKIFFITDGKAAALTEEDLLLLAPHGLR